MIVMIWFSRILIVELSIRSLTTFQIKFIFFTYPYLNPRISFVFIILTYLYVVFQALTINTRHSCSPNISSSVGPYRFCYVAINIRYMPVSMFQVSTRNIISIPGATLFNSKPIFHGCHPQFQNMIFKLDAVP